MANNKEELIIQLKSLFDDEGFKAMSQSLQELDKKVKEFEAESKKLEKTSLSLENIGQSAKKMQLTVTAPIVAAGTAAVMGASEIEKFTASFTTMLGNEKKAETLIKQLNKMAAVTPFDPEPLIKSSQTLLAYQIELEDVEGTLKMLGDASSGSAEALESLSVAYGKIATKGKASMEELNIMIDRGVPILEYLGQTLNKTGNEIIEMTSKGEISFNDVNAAFQKMTSEGGVFYNGMATASETLAGKTSTLKGNIDLLAAGLAEDLLPIIKSAVDALNSIVVGFQGMDESQKAAILTTAAVAAALPPVITAVTSMTKSIKAMTAAMKAGNAAALANPYVAVGVAIASIVAGLTAWLIKQNSIEAKLKNLQKQSEKTAQSIQAVVDAREAEQAAIEAGASAEAEKQKKLQAEIELQKNLEEQLKKTAKAAQNNRIDLADWTKRFEENKKEIEKLNAQKAAGGKTTPKERGSVARIPIDDKIKQLEEGIPKLEERISELRVKISDFNKEMVDDVAAAMRAGIDAETIVLSKANDLTRSTAKDVIEQAQKLNEEIKEKQEAEKRKQQQQEKQSTSAAEVKDEKDRFDLLAEIYQKFNENKIKIESGLLRESEKNALQAENAKNEALYKEYEAYLKSKEELTEEFDEVESGKNENASLNSLKAYLDKMEDLNWGYYADYQEFLDVQQEADEQFLADNLEAYIAYLQAKADAGRELSEAEQSALARYIQLQGELDGVSNDKLINELNTIADMFSDMSIAFVGELKTANIYAEQLGANFGVASDAASLIIGNISELADSLNDAARKSELIGNSLAVGLQAAGEIADNIFSAVVENISSGLEEAITAIEGDLSATLKKLEDGYNADIAAAEEAKNAKLQLLKDEYAQRGLIIETGLESELGKAQKAYRQALEALQEYEDETTSARQKQLDAYKEQLAVRNDEDIQAALESKERELAAVDDKKKAELQKNADTKKAELERQKIIDDAEKKTNEIKNQYQYERDLAEYNSEVAKLTREHEMAVEQFNIKKAQDIANIWIAQAAGIATIWATAMQLGPIAGPIAAGVLTGTLATVAGVQTGLIAAQAPPSAPSMPEPPAKYMTGGVIPGNDNDDRTLLFASSGERVLTQQQNDNFERLVNSLENGGNSPVINVHVYVDSEEIGIERQLIEIQKKDKWSGRWGM